MPKETFILDHPDQIEAYRILATRSGLELEIKWGATGGPTRGMALASARRILTQYNVPGTAWGAQRNAVSPRTRKQALAGMRYLCKQLGFDPSRQEQQEAQQHAQTSQQG